MKTESAIGRILAVILWAVNAVVGIFLWDTITSYSFGIPGWVRAALLALFGIILIGLCAFIYIGMWSRDLD